MKDVFALESEITRAVAARFERVAHLTKQLHGTLHSRLIGLHTIFTFALCL